MDEFIEYYNNVSCNIPNDAYFDLMISNAWGLNGSSNPANMPYAGTARKINNVNAREAYRQDHHRNLFGTDTGTPFAKNTPHSYQTSGSLEAGGHQPQPAAGSATIHNPNAYSEEFGHVNYTGLKHADNELLISLRDALKARGARGIIGL